MTKQDTQKEILEKHGIFTDFISQRMHDAISRSMEDHASERTAPLLEALKWIRKEGYKKGSGVIHKYVSDALKNYNHE